jgi:hypothetical protein
LRHILDAGSEKPKSLRAAGSFKRDSLVRRIILNLRSIAANLTPLSPANVLREFVFSALKKAEIEWLAYHVFRRGLATNLRALGVDDLTQ